MRRKPILMNNLNGKLSNKKRFIIGVIGTHRGVGVTHFAIMLAQFINEKMSAKTALLECNEHNDFRYLQMAYLGVDEELDLSRQFTIYDVTYFENVRDNEVAYLLNEDFEYFVLDLGCEFEQNKKEFLRSDMKLVIGSLTEWRRKDLMNFLDKTSHFHGYDTFLYLMVFGIKKEMEEFKREWKIGIRSVPFEPDPFLLSKNSLKFFQQF